MYMTMDDGCTARLVYQTPRQFEGTTTKYSRLSLEDQEVITVGYRFSFGILRGVLFRASEDYPAPSL